ncbi:hypothetical protein TH25_15975 [Thalassospira profundimaris]|uniref:Uncharacterized protein n=1 Tax=Thalassospira profundimaris TaxID=502049 RepID=A0A367X003_9PROT|nr:hypothetical protein TH25_15975 [Thalassospira profundimaris]
MFNPIAACQAGLFAFMAPLLPIGTKNRDDNKAATQNGVSCRDFMEKQNAPNRGQRCFQRN